MASKTFNIVAAHAIQHLQACLDEISQPFADSNIKCFQLSLDHIEVTPTILDLLVQILIHPLPTVPIGVEIYWDCVSLWHCKLSREGSNRLAVAGEGFCSEDSIEILISILASRPSRLQLSESPEILECLFNAPHLERKLTELSVLQERFSVLECAMIGNLVQRAVSWKLFLSVGDFEEFIVFGEGLANAFHLQTVGFHSTRNRNLHDILVRDGDCIVRQLLSTPQSRLERLVLSDMHLTDYHLHLIAEMLPTSSLQVLNLSYNLFEGEGILAFACQLPRIKCLKRLDLSHSHWDIYKYSSTREHATIYRDCIAALREGMYENYYLECLRLYCDNTQLKYLTNTNRIRRQILDTCFAIPVGLWPLILKKVGSQPRDSTWGDNEKFQRRATTALYFVLQNCPILSSAAF